MYVGHVHPRGIWLFSFGGLHADIHSGQVQKLHLNKEKHLKL
jgi:hypothetical protein